MYDEQTHDRKNYFGFIFVTHIIHVQCTDGREIVRAAKDGRGIVWGGKRREGNCLGWQNTGEELSGVEKIVLILRSLKHCLVLLFMNHRPIPSRIIPLPSFYAINMFNLKYHHFLSKQVHKL